MYFRYSFFFIFPEKGWVLPPDPSCQGFLTGGTQAAITYPTEYVKTQLQLQSFLSWVGLVGLDGLDLSPLKSDCLVSQCFSGEKISCG